MPKSEREETLAALTARIFSSMLDELIMDATLQSHQEVLRAKSVCPVCNTRCGSIHNTPVTNGSDGVAIGQRSDTPFSAGSNEANKVQMNGSNGTSTPTNLKGDPGPLLECVVCSRPMAANRYAPHLSSCMGFNNTRRVAARGNAKPSKPPSEEDQSPPPSDDGELSDDKAYINGKAKGKAKGKKTGDEADFSLKRKRVTAIHRIALQSCLLTGVQPGSPQGSPNKKAKKGSPISRVKADLDAVALLGNSHYSPSTNSQSKIPSKLRDSSVASFQDGSSSSSRESSPDAALAAPTPSSFSSQSPTRPIVTNKASRGRPPAMGTGPPKRPTPPNRPIHVPDYHIEIDHANETGSSTDTDGE
ncbi:hypothetical protein CVT26_000434 [Gymnopilus dilepis]|uniref:SAGA-associated factor 11 n=1 Tax=Gymnopilus dilepis TaxID=231916 RepID=A0A409Y2J3_9AGAR|nr:hypothetical protein CVT26_000434 [Gymnopilus dilepis]